MYKYEYTQTNTLNKSRAGGGYSSQDLTQWNVWHNGTVRDSNASNYTTIFTKFQYGEDAPSDSLRVLPLSNGPYNWVEIQFNKTLHVSITGGNYEHINCDRDWTECGPGQGMTDIDGEMQNDFHLNFVVKINGTMGAWNWRYMLGTQGNLAHIQLYCCEQPLGATITQQVI